MTAYGVNITSHDPITTHDWKPSHVKRTSPELIEAERKFDDVNGRYLAYVDRLERGEAIDYDLLHELGDQVTAAEKLMLSLKRSLNNPHSTSLSETNLHRVSEGVSLMQEVH